MTPAFIPKIGSGRLLNAARYGAAFYPVRPLPLHQAACPREISHNQISRMRARGEGAAYEIRGPRRVTLFVLQFRKRIGVSLP